ncbi:hypothetical protein EVAR_16559_1 [Eumeta japonica]|uniref:YqaJ viral recombinase domain-containing protein n=1 Tax=Eumeta variegata TaxID=151549 RepID=A0A4C1U4D3_EUMVA|nr:hypothetical protein EVAR_16559_1 [Eumeta japonica]
MRALKPVHPVIRGLHAAGAGRQGLASPLHIRARKPAAPDIENHEQAKEEYLIVLKELTKDKKRIQRETILKRDSSEWLSLRRNLLTASNFGIVIKRRLNIKCAPWVKNLLYKQNLYHVSAHTHGIKNEEIALEQLAVQERVNIEPCDIFIDEELLFIGASPDGLIGTDMC